MPLNPDMKALLELLVELGMKDFSESTPEELRSVTLSPPPEVPTAVGNVEDRTISISGSDTPIPVRIYQPQSPSGAALVFFHGGGWVIGDLESHDETCRTLCSRADICVVAVDYRLAPETRYPGALEDCYHATLWLAENADEFGVDPSRIAVGGDSAGANLAAATALKARDQRSVPIRFQLLIYPVTDADFNTPSYLENAEGYLLSRAAMQWFWDHYAPDIAQRDEPYAAPLRAENLSGLPPALVQTAEFDPLRDEGEAYASALARAGIKVQQTRYNGLTHGYFGMEAAVPAVSPAITEAVDALRSALH